MHFDRSYIERKDLNTLLNSSFKAKIFNEFSPPFERKPEHDECECEQDGAKHKKTRYKFERFNMLGCDDRAHVAHVVHMLILLFECFTSIWASNTLTSQMYGEHFSKQ